MSDLAVAIGLVFVIEGLIYGGFPGHARRLARQVVDLPETTLRMAGIASIAFGVLVVWLARG